jgi:hypothetical protein
MSTINDLSVLARFQLGRQLQEDWRIVAAKLGIDTSSVERCVLGFDTEETLAHTLVTILQRRCIPVDDVIKALSNTQSLDPVLAILHPGSSPVDSVPTTIVHHIEDSPVSPVWYTQSSPVPVHSEFPEKASASISVEPLISDDEDNPPPPSPEFSRKVTTSINDEPSTSQPSIQEKVESVNEIVDDKFQQQLGTLSIKILSGIATQLYRDFRTFAAHCDVDAGISHRLLKSNHEDYCDASSALLNHLITEREFTIQQIIDILKGIHRNDIANWIAREI